MDKQFLGNSDKFLDFLDQVSKVAKIDRPVLLVGERGTGKEKASRRLHYLSPRWNKPLVVVNCAALTPSLIEAELFGHEAGAFTGAKDMRRGRFEEAEGGTLFLDEIALIPLQVQEKLLRAVEYHTYERVGSSETRRADVRIIGATNTDLPALCRAGRFKQDFLDRLSFEVLFLPPLRFRGDDVILLASYFAQKMAMECSLTPFAPFLESECARLYDYSWPGNVRELKNVVERAVYRSEGVRPLKFQFNPFENPYEESPSPSESGVDLENYQSAKIELDIRYLQEALKRADGNQKKASRLLNLSYDQFRGLYRKYENRLYAPDR